MVSFAVQKLLSLIWPHLFIFAFISFASTRRILRTLKGISHRLLVLQSMSYSGSGFCIPQRWPLSLKDFSACSLTFPYKWNWGLGRELTKSLEQRASYSTGLTLLFLPYSPQPDSRAQSSQGQPTSPRAAELSSSSPSPRLCSFWLLSVTGTLGLSESNRTMCVCKVFMPSTSHADIHKHTASC